MVTPNYQKRPGLYHPTKSEAEIPKVMLKLFKLPSHITAAQGSRIFPKATAGKASCT